MANENQKILLDLLKIEGNSICADCGKKGEEIKITAYHIIFLLWFLISLESKHQSFKTHLSLDNEMHKIKFY